MKIKLFLCTASVIFCTQAYSDDSCDVALTPQTHRETSNLQLKISTLKMVTEENYETSKKGASASYSDFFSGSYSEFAEKRRKYFEENRFNLSIQDAWEINRSFLSDAQLEKWAECKKNIAQPIVRYKKSDEIGGDLVIEWSPSEPLGALEDFTVDLVNGSHGRLPKKLEGTLGISVSRINLKEAIRGSVNGTTGSLWRKRQRTAYIYIPPTIVEDITPPPEKLVVSENGRVLTSWAYWGGDVYPMDVKWRTSWQCFTVPSGFDLVQVTPERVVHYPVRKKGQCVNGSQYCTARDEHCTDIVVSEGCIINSTWHKWYREKMKKLGLPYTEAAVCKQD